MCSDSESPTFGDNANRYYGRNLLSPTSENSFHDILSANRSNRATPNEISAPYEVPQFPIEEIERKLAIQRQLSTTLRYNARKTCVSISSLAINKQVERKIPISVDITI